MGDTYGAWVAEMENGTKHLIVHKAYAAAQYVARQLGPVKDITLIATNNPARKGDYASVTVMGEIS